MRALQRLSLALGFATLAFAVNVSAQAPAKPQPAANVPTRPASAPPRPSAADAPKAAPQGSTDAGLPQPENYTYNSDGRRDPFVSLIGGGSSTENRVTSRGEGASAFGVGDISVRGVMQSRGTLVAMVEGPNKKTYIVHQGDKLLDGVIKTITPQGLVVIQDVNDPLSLVKQREVSKLLRSLEGGK